MIPANALPLLSGEGAPKATDEVIMHKPTLSPQTAATLKAFRGERADCTTPLLRARPPLLKRLGGERFRG